MADIPSFEASSDDTVPYEHFIRLLSCVQACYKYTLGDKSMHPLALQDLMLDTLEHVMGQHHLARWLQREHLRQEPLGEESPDA